MISRRTLLGSGAAAALSLASCSALAQGFPYMTDFALRGTCASPNEATLRNPEPVRFSPFADYTELVAARRSDPTGGTLSLCNSFTKAWITPGKVGLTLTDGGQPSVILSPYIDATGAPGLVLDMLLETRVDNVSMSNFTLNYPGVKRFFYPIATDGAFSFGFDNGEVSGDLIRQSSSDVLLAQGTPYNVRITLTSTGLMAYRCSIDLLDRLSQKKAEEKNFNVVNILSGNLRLTYSTVSYLKFMSTGELETYPYTIKEVPILTRHGVKNFPEEDAAILKVSMAIKSTVRSLVPVCSVGAQRQLPSYGALQQAAKEP
ncbi:hypothetical protein [Sorangium sp. So ce542]|uniref:hypothetical protein n=1 Tax=Sorangium sp. So ce542 TaxID=3133316 RepID=UPI003F5F3929